MMLFRTRDFIVVALACVLIYLSYDTDSFTYTLQPAWYYDQKHDHDNPSSSSSISYNYFNSNRYINPIVADMNGDGLKEIVIITNDMQLKIMSTNSEAEEDVINNVYQPSLLASIKLNALNFKQGKLPVAMRTGYIEKYNSDKVRNQVIVIVREDWTVVCYDHTLRLLWEKAVAHKSHEIDMIISKYKIDEISIMISPTALIEDSAGVVVVGARMRLRGTNGSRIDTELGLDMNEDGSKEHVDLDMRSSLEHFSLYALSANNGHIIWRHDGFEVKPEQYTISLPQHAYKLDAKDLVTKVHHGAGFNHWVMFKESLLAELPHDWSDPADTSLRIAKFARSHVGATATNNNMKANTGISSKGKANTLGSVSSGMRFTAIDTPPVPKTASLPHDSSEHTESPNVIVAHTSKGVEVISLKSGVPITSLALSAKRSYADVDGDGVVDTILVLESKEDADDHYDSMGHYKSKMPQCTMVVISGLPAQSQLFNGTLCATRVSLQDPALSHDRGKSPLPHVVAAAAPAILRRIDKKTLQESKLRDIVIAINTGIITSYSGDGKLNWQYKSGPTWKVGYQHATAMLFDSDALRVDDLGKHDNVHAQLLVMGDDEFSLLSRQGDVLATAEIPNQPIGRPIIGDFNSDGVTDVIIITANAILGYRLEIVKSVNIMLYGTMILIFIAVVVFIANIKYDTGGSSGRSSSSFTTSMSVNKMKKHVLSLARSTDDYHLD